MDVACGVVHSLTGTAANEADITQMAAVLHGQEEAVFADAGYTGAANRPEHAARAVSWNIAVKRGIIRARPKALRDLAEAEERVLAQVRGRSLPPRKPGSSTPFTSSRTCSAIKSCAIAGWPKTPRNSTPCSPWPIWRSSRRRCSRQPRRENPETTLIIEQHTNIAAFLGINREILPTEPVALDGRLRARSS